MDITPNVNLLRSLRGDRIDYVLLVGEAIDNAFDAGAQCIDINVDANEISFRDDGVGIRKDKIAAVFSLGEHGPMTTTQLGRFGIGIKSQAVNTGNLFEISSVSVDGRVKVSVDWRDVLKSGKWSIDDPRWLPVAVGSQTGTTITIAELRSTKAPSGGWSKKIAVDAAERFYPAIAEGKRITLNGESVLLLPDPAMTHVVEQNVSLSGGRSAHLRAGILIAPSRLNRVHVSYKHRVIMPASSIGCGEYGGLTKMFARLQLSGPWHLAKFKNDLTDEDEREELEAAVSELLKPILEKCNSASLSARIQHISNIINDLVPSELAAARPKKQKDTPPQAAQKRPRRQGYVDQDKSDQSDSPAKTKRPPRDRLLITFDGVADEDGVGAFQSGRPHRVNLSKDDPYIARLLEHRDQDLAVRSLYAIAIGLFEHGRELLNPQPDLPLESYGKRIARQLSIQDRDEVAA